MTDSSLHPYLVSLAMALVHSLWVFTVVISLGYVLGRSIHAARWRYRTYLVTLCCLPLCFVGLLYLGAAGPEYGIGELALGTETAGVFETVTDPEPATADSFYPFWMPYLGVAYLLGLVLMGLRSAQDYRRGRALRRTSVPPPPAERRRFDRLRHRFGTLPAVRWLISTRVDTVMVLGVLRPVILFPVGLLAQLTVAEVEAVLLHELAHLRRTDHRWVVVQRLLRDLFFFHPLVHWLCGQLDREREYACDDLVVGGGNIPRPVYARALLRVARYSDSLTSQSSPTMALRATTSPFGLRLRRLLPSATPARSGGRFPYLLVLLLVAGSWALARAESPELPPAAAIQAEQAVVRGRVLDGGNLKPLIGATVLAEVDGKTFGTVTDVDGRYALTVPAGERELSFTYVGYTTTARTIIAEGNTDVDVLMSKEGSDGEALEPSPSTILISGDSKPLSEQNILYIVDGKRYENGNPTSSLSPDSIEKVSVFKKADDIERFGYGTDFDGVIVIDLKKE